jgi:hypothetical protein
MSSISLSVVVFGFFSRAMVPSQISARLNEQIYDAIPTAMPVFGHTRMFGNDVGRSAGSSMVLS